MRAVVVDVHVVAIRAVATNTANRRRIDEPKGPGLFPSAFAFCSRTGAVTRTRVLAPMRSPGVGPATTLTMARRERFSPAGSQRPYSHFPAAENPLLRLPAVRDNAAKRTDPSKSDPPSRKRRWFQFSRRTLLVFTLICAIWRA